jgi:hypothetical protein
MPKKYGDRVHITGGLTADADELTDAQLAAIATGGSLALDAAPFGAKKPNGVH